MMTTGYTHHTPMDMIKMCIVCEGIDQLKPVGKLTAEQRKLFNTFADDLRRTQGVNLRDRGNLQVWETRGVLLLDPLSLGPHQLTEIISKLSAFRSNLRFALLGVDVSVYKPMIDSREKGHTCLVSNHPMKGDGSSQRLGMFNDTNIDWNN